MIKFSEMQRTWKWEVGTEGFSGCSSSMYCTLSRCPTITSFCNSQDDRLSHTFYLPYSKWYTKNRKQTENKREPEGWRARKRTVMRIAHTRSHLPTKTRTHAYEYDRWNFFFGKKFHWSFFLAVSPETENGDKQTLQMGPGPPLSDYDEVDGGVSTTARTLKKHVYIKNKLTKLKTA